MIKCIRCSVQSKHDDDSKPKSKENASKSNLEKLGHTEVFVIH